MLEFLADPAGRTARAKEWRNHGSGYIEDYGGKPETLNGLSVDWPKSLIHFPPGLKDWQISTTKASVLSDPAPQTGELTRYRRIWLGGILSLYRKSSTKFVFIQMPRAPLSLPDATVPARFVMSVISRPRLTVLPETTFKDLESPGLFADGIHLNRYGRPIFSERLGRTLAAMFPETHATSPK